MLKSKYKKWYYVGSTNNLFRRISEHNSGKTNSTKAYKPFILVFSTKFQTEKEARTYEHKIKNCRREKEKIIKILNSA